MLENRKNWKNILITLLLLSLLGISFLNVMSLGLAQSNNYDLKLTKGTTIFSVETYDEDAWFNTVSNSLNPSHWFGGDANITGAQSKITIKGWSYTEWGTFNVISSIVLPQEQLLILYALADYGYNNTEINEYYPNTYWLWNSLQAIWPFTSNNFDEKPNTTEQNIILKDPEDYRKILDDYNKLVAQIKNDSAVPLPIKNQISNITADDLLWKLALNTFAAAEPVGNYLLTVTDALETENITASSCSLIFNRTGLNNYTVEFAYGDRGTLTSVIVKDQIDNTIYYITSINSEWIFYMILAIAVAASIGIIVVLTLRSRKIKRA